ncbi:MAG TPA: DUF4215 domain-containing protein, partial [Polyangiaceae bacterium]
MTNRLDEDVFVWRLGLSGPDDCGRAIALERRSAHSRWTTATAAIPSATISWQLRPWEVSYGMARSARIFGSIGLLFFLLAAGCSNSSSIDLTQQQGGTGNTSTGSGIGNTGNGSSIGIGKGGNSGGLSIGTQGVSELARNCGNGKQDTNEQCDDGNQEGKDGCTRLCQIEVDWVCNEWGKPCTSSAVCGDGKLSSVEACDDKNTNDDDGCSSDCKKVQEGWQCRVPGRACIPLCGDSKKTGGER